MAQGAANSASATDVRTQHLILALVQARRCLQIYPQTNPLVKQAFEKLRDALQSAGAVTDENGSGRLACEIRSDGFYSDQGRLAGERADVERFALLLYREGAKLIWFDPAADVTEIAQFLDASIALEQGKATEDQRAHLRQQHLGLEFVDEALIGERQGETPDIRAADLLAHLIAQKGRRVLTPEGAPKPRQHINDVLSVFLAAERGDMEANELLMATMSDPERLAQTLSFITHGDEAVQEPTEQAAHALRQTLRHIDICMEEFPEDLREHITQNLAEAVITTDADSRSCMIDAVLPPGLGNGGIEDALAMQLPPRAAASVLLRHIQVHDGTASTVAGFLENLKDAHKDRVISSMHEAINNLPPQQATPEQKETLRSMVPQPRPEIQSSPMPAPSREAAVERQQKMMELAREKLILTREEAVGLRQQIALTSDLTDEQQDALTFFHMYAVGTIDQEERMMAHLQETLRHAIDKRNFEFANHIVQLAMGQLRPDTREEAMTTLMPYLRALYRENEMTTFLNHLVSLAKANPADEGCQNAFHTLAADATPALFERLEREKTKGNRFALLNLLLEVGPDILEFLHQQANHPQWYVVRNTVFLLGKIADDKSIAVLEQAMEHPEPRVRREVLQALLRFPRDAAGPLIAKTLDDPDAHVREDAAESLGKLGDARWSPLLAERLREDAWALRKQPDFTLALLSALALIGTRQAIPALRQFLRISLWPGTIKRPLLRETTRFAITQILLRDQRGADGQPVSVSEGEVRADAN